MKATVFYVTLTKGQRDELTIKGWGGTLGRAYLAAKDGNYKVPGARSLLTAAAELEATTNEEVYRKLQNLDEAWTAQADVKCLTGFPRSMDVGDIIVWADGRHERVASFGFDTVTDLLLVS